MLHCLFCESIGLALRQCDNLCTYCSLLCSAYFFLDNMIIGSVSLSHIHTLTHTHITHTHIESPSQLTLPQRHLSLGKARWWMQVGGWYASAHFCVRLGVRMSSIKGERRETSTYCTICVSCSIQPRLWDLRLLSLSLSCPVDISCSLPCRLPVSSTHSCVPEICRRDAISSVMFRPALHHARPLSEQVADCGTKAKALSLQS